MDAQLFKNRYVLHDNTDLTFNFIIVRSHILSHDPDASPVILQKRKHTVDRCRLSRAVRPEKSEDFPLFYFQIKMIQRQYVAVPFHEIFYPDHMNPPVLIS